MLMVGRHPKSRESQRMNAGITTIGQSTKREGKENKNFIHLKTLSYQGFYTLYTKNTEIKKFPYIMFQNEFLLSPIYIFILMYKAYKVYKTIAKPLVLLTLFFIHFQK